MGIDLESGDQRMLHLVYDTDDPHVRLTMDVQSPVAMLINSSELRRSAVGHKLRQVIPPALRAGVCANLRLWILTPVARLFFETKIRTTFREANFLKWNLDKSQVQLTFEVLVPVE